MPPTPNDDAVCLNPNFFLDQTKNIIEVLLESTSDGTIKDELINLRHEIIYTISLTPKDVGTLVLMQPDLKISNAEFLINLKEDSNKLFADRINKIVLQNDTQQHGGKMGFFEIDLIAVLGIVLVGILIIPIGLPIWGIYSLLKDESYGLLSTIIKNKKNKVPMHFLISVITVGVTQENLDLFSSKLEKDYLNAVTKNKSKFKTIDTDDMKMMTLIMTMASKMFYIYDDEMTDKEIIKLFRLVFSPVTITSLMALKKQDEELDNYACAKNIGFPSELDYSSTKTLLDKITKTLNTIKANYLFLGRGKLHKILEGIIKIASESFEKGPHVPTALNQEHKPTALNQEHNKMPTPYKSKQEILQIVSAKIAADDIKSPVKSPSNKLLQDAIEYMNTSDKTILNRSIKRVLAQKTIKDPLEKFTPKQSIKYPSIENNDVTVKKKKDSEKEKKLKEKERDKERKRKEKEIEKKEKKKEEKKE